MLTQSIPGNNQVGCPALYKLRLEVRKIIAKAGFNEVAVGLSGGADSLALTAALNAEKLKTHALIVDHGLQESSYEVAKNAYEQALNLGCTSARIISIQIKDFSGGMEAAARAERYQALENNRNGLPVFLAHTMDDQAETVLLGLARGAGSKSIQGMQVFNPPWYRPFLDVRRAETEKVMEELGLNPYKDPQNNDKRFTRVRLRQEVIPLLNEVLKGGSVKALAKTAKFLQQDNSYLEAVAQSYFEEIVKDCVSTVLPVDKLEGLAPSIRLRVIKLWLSENNYTFISAVQLESIDALISNWKGQGAVAICGNGVNVSEIELRSAKKNTKDNVVRVVVLRKKNFLMLNIE